MQCSGWYGVLCSAFEFRVGQVPFPVSRQFVEEFWSRELAAEDVGARLERGAGYERPGHYGVVPEPVDEFHDERGRVVVVARNSEGAAVRVA
jgi:hypothetical protein